MNANLANLIFVAKTLIKFGKSSIKNARRAYYVEIGNNCINNILL